MRIKRQNLKPVLRLDDGDKIKGVTLKETSSVTKRSTASVVVWALRCKIRKCGSLHEN